MSSQAPSVSVILPTHNREGELGAALESVLAQSYDDLELIVVDDASTDRTGELVRAVGDPRIRYLRLPHNRGAAVARNTGIDAARAGYLAFQDSDDRWEPDKLALQMERFAAAPQSVGLVYCAYRRVDPDGVVQVVPPADGRAREGRIHREVLRRSFIGTPTMVLRRACLTRVGGFDEALPRFQDWELVIRVTREFEARFVDRVLVTAGWGGANITAGHDEALLRAEGRILERHAASFRQAGLLAERTRHLAHVTLMAGHAAEGRALFRRALALEPGPRTLALLALASSRALYAAAYRVWDRRRRPARRAG